MYSYIEDEGLIFDFGGTGSEPESKPSFFDGILSGAKDIFSDVGKAALSDVVTAGKERIQTEVKNSLLGGNVDKISVNDTGRLATSTNQTDRTGMMASSFIPTSFIPNVPDSISNFSISKYAPFMLLGLAGIAGLIILKKFI